MDLTSQTIPAWLVAANMLYAGIISLVALHKHISISKEALAFTFILQGLVYLLFFQVFPLDVETRGFYSRAMVVLLSLSVSFPLTVQIYREIFKHDNSGH